MAVLVGDATTTHPIGNTVNAGLIETFVFTAAATGTVDTLQIRTTAVANTGMTSLILGVYADNGSGTAPTTSSAPIGQGTFSGVPPTSTWVSVTGLSIPVVAGTRYWLAYLALGAAFHNAYAVASGGTAAVNSTAGGLSSMGVVSGGWGGIVPVGPIGYQGTGNEAGAVSSFTYVALLRSGRTR